ncbi:MAG: hypothetical protein ACKO2V_08785 [Snowella sp.]
MSNSTLISKPTQSTQTLSSQLLGQILLRKRCITIHQLEAALAQQKNCSLKLGELLIQQGKLHPSQLEEALKEQTWRQKGLWVI